MLFTYVQKVRRCLRQAQSHKDALAFKKNPIKVTIKYDAELII